MRTALVCVRTPVAAQSITACAARLGVTTIRAAASEAEALARLEEHPSELILVDTAVSRPDPVGFTRRVLALAPRAVLLLFGAEDPQVARGAVAAGARGLIRAVEQEPVLTVIKALLLIGTPRQAPAVPAAPGAAGPAPGSGPGPAEGAGPGGGAGSGSGAGPGGGAGQGAGPGGSPAGPVRAAPANGAGRPEVGPGLVLVPAQRGDLPGPGGPGVAAAGLAAVPGVDDPVGPQWRASLTERELQVLRGMAEGKSNAEIGRDLYVSEDTVKTHARRLFRKLRARDRAHAVAVGFRAGALH